MQPNSPVVRGLNEVSTVGIKHYSRDFNKKVMEVRPQMKIHSNIT